jgi:hypothetical protein
VGNLDKLHHGVSIAIRGQTNRRIDRIARAVMVNKRLSELDWQDNNFHEKA